MSRVRVLELIKTLDVGGAEMLLLSRLRVADRDRFDYAVGYLDAARAELVPAFEETGIPVRCFAAASSLDWRWLWPLRRYLREHHVDVVHVHSPLMAAGVRAVVRSLGRRRPALVSTEHSVRYNRLTQLLDLATVRGDDLVVAVSDAVSRSPVCRAARRVEMIHYGVDVERLRQLRSERDGLASELALADGPRVITVANLRPEKAYDVLLKVARIVHNDVPEAHFYVAGRGALEEWIHNEVRQNGMGGYFHVLGRVPDAARLSACGDVFVLSSSWEGRPVALMEAIAAGVPAVVTAVGGVPDIVRDGYNGRLVAPGDSGMLAAAIVSVLRDADLRDKLAEGALESGREYDMARAAEAVEAHYLRLVARSNRTDG